MPKEEINKFIGFLSNKMNHLNNDNTCLSDYSHAKESSQTMQKLSYLRSLSCN